MMTNVAHFLAHYESIAHASSQMLAAARRSDWDELICAERECAALIERLKSLGPGPTLDEAARERKFALIRSVLAHDAEIRNLTQPWLARLASLLEGSAAGRRAIQAYR